jgi:uncharacterized membrane protein (UPF0127 family)
MANTHTTTASMTVKIVVNDKGNPPGKLAEAELHFSDGPLAGLKVARVRGLGAPRRVRTKRDVSRAPVLGQRRAPELRAAAADRGRHSAGAHPRPRPRGVRRVRSCGVRTGVIPKRRGAASGAPPQHLASRGRAVTMDGVDRQGRPWFRRTVIAAGIVIPLITATMWMWSADRVPPTVRIETPRGTIVAEIAATPSAGSAGLSNRDKLQGTDGMLLKWDAPGRHPMWMAGMRFPLDLLWIDGAGRVLAVVPNVPLCRVEPCTLYEPDGTASAVAVLELPAGGAAERRLATGVSVRFPGTNQ